MVGKFGPTIECPRDESLYSNIYPNLCYTDHRRGLKCTFLAPMKKRHFITFLYLNIALSICEHYSFNGAMPDIFFTTSMLYENYMDIFKKYQNAGTCLTLVTFSLLFNCFQNTSLVGPDYLSPKKKS